jgi:hypothetical protein
MMRPVRGLKVPRASAGPDANKKDLPERQVFFICMMNYLEMNDE